LTVKEEMTTEFILVMALIQMVLIGFLVYRQNEVQMIIVMN